MHLSKLKFRLDIWANSVNPYSCDKCRDVVSMYIELNFMSHSKDKRDWFSCLTPCIIIYSCVKHYHIRFHHSLASVVAFCTRFTLWIVIYTFAMGKALENQTHHLQHHCNSYHYIVDQPWLMKVPSTETSKPLPPGARGLVHTVS